MDICLGLPLVGTIGQYAESAGICNRHSLIDTPEICLNFGRSGISADKHSPLISAYALMSTCRLATRKTFTGLRR